MEIETNRSVRNDVMIIIKESLRFALVGVILFSVVGTSLLYLLLKFTELDGDIAAMLAGIVVAIFIVIVDEKRLHTVSKITDCNRRIIRKVLKI